MCADRFRAFLGLVSLVLFLRIGIEPITAIAAKWTYGERDDDDLLLAMQELTVHIDEATERATEGVAILMQRHYIEMREDETKTSFGRVLYVVDSTVEEVAEQMIALRPGDEVEMAKGWIIRSSGELERVEKKSVDVRDGDDVADPRVLIAYPQLQDGDMIGWSVRSKGGLTFDRHLPLSGSLPISRGEIFLKTDGRRAYTFFLRNIREGEFTGDELERENGAISLYRFTYRDLDPRKSEIFDLPFLAREPLLRIAYLGAFDSGCGRWNLLTSWNQVAVFYDELQRDLTKKEKDVKKVAERLTEGLIERRAIEDRLYEFVRDEIVSVDGWESRELRSPKVALKERVATNFEKGFLLAALMRAKGIGAEVFYVLPPVYGEVNHHNPGLWQFEATLVRTFDQREWFCPSEPGSPPRSIARGFIGAQALRLDMDLEDEVEDAINDLYAKIGNRPCRLGVALEDWMKAQQWHDFVLLETSSRSEIPELSETIVVQKSSSLRDLEVISRGHTSLAVHVRRESSTGRSVEWYLSGRHPSWAREEPDYSDAGLEVNGTELQLSCSVDGGPLPAPQGDSWILSPEQIYGKHPLDGWEGPERGAFYVPYSRIYRWRYSAPLPDGWATAARPEDLRIECPQFRYIAQFSFEEGDLILERMFELREGTTAREHIPQLDANISRMLDFERTPLLITRSDE